MKRRPALFEPVRVGSLELSNRIVIAPMSLDREFSEAADVSPKTPVQSNCACAVPEKVKRCKIFEFSWRTAPQTGRLRHLLDFASLNFSPPGNGLSFV
jgi:hypothetical protein